jgi:hypothetical protein
LIGQQPCVTLRSFKASGATHTSARDHLGLVMGIASEMTDSPTLRMLLQLLALPVPPRPTIERPVAGDLVIASMSKSSPCQSANVPRRDRRDAISPAGRAWPQSCRADAAGDHRIDRVARGLIRRASPEGQRMASLKASVAACSRTFAADAAAQRRIVILQFDAGRPLTRTKSVAKARFVLGRASLPRSIDNERRVEGSGHVR